MAGPLRTITLLTDFGLRDHFVSAMKGVILTLNPEVSIIDISHLIPPQDIFSAAFVLSQTYPYFPPYTIHIAVVDPGVGTDRKAIAVSAGGQYFVAPDNGILTYVLEREEDAKVYHMTADHYFRKPVSATFHGRDVFAPAAAWISRNTSLHQLGSELDNAVRLELPRVARIRENLIKAAVIAVDHFGNLVTNLKAEDLPVFSAPGTEPCKLLVNQKEIASFHKTYAEGAEGEVFVVPGSTGYLEIAVRNGSASSVLETSAGTPIGVVIG